MGELLRLELPATRRLRALSAEALERARDMRPVWDVGAAAFRLEMDRQFRTQGRYLLGERWVPLSPAYAHRKPQPPAPFGILYRSGELYRSLHDASHPDHVYVRTQTAMEIGTRVPYAAYHQYGTRKMPARPIIKVRGAYIRLLVRAAVAWILRGTRLDRERSE